MTDWEKIINKVLENEGGFVDHRLDPGGATNHGVSLRWLLQLGDVDNDGVLEGDFDGDGDVDVDDIRMMTREDSIKLYRERWWEPNHYSQIHSIRVAYKAFDFAINMGTKGSGRIIQRAVNRVMADHLKVDGNLGAKSIQAINGIVSTRKAHQQLVRFICAEALARYVRIYEKDPSRYVVFLLGWSRRAFEMLR